MNLDEAILAHLEKGEVRDQAELLLLLEKQGFALTVSTLSRHLKKLQVRKEAGVYRRQDARQMVGMSFTMHKVPPCLLVIRTHSGYAQALALLLDEARIPTLAGTVAGDDTIFAAPVDGSKLDQLEAEIRRKLMG
jgi:transcriptional regulator of arginine metabolism